MAINVYSTPSCTYCKLVKKFLKEKGVKYTDFNVATDQRRAEEMVKKSGQMGVPVVDVNGKIIVGFDQPEIEKALTR